jgi:hypothetical protein
MNIIPDELKTQTFPCPECGQIVSSEVDVCRFCSTKIDPELRASAIRRESDERKAARLRGHKTYIIGGSIVFAFGSFGLFIPLLESYLNVPNINFSCWTPALLAGGAVVAIKGLIGYREEKRSGSNNV